MTTKSTGSTDSSDERTAKAARDENASSPAPDAALSISNGPEQSPVLITGKGFGDKQGTVFFNDVAGPVGSWTDRSVLTSVPYGATTGPITLRAADGRTFTAGQFTVDPGVWSETDVTDQVGDRRPGTAPPQTGPGKGGEPPVGS